MPTASDADPFVHRLRVERRDDSGPLGSFYRVETQDAQSLTTIGNPVFLQPPDAAP